MPDTIITRDDLTAYVRACLPNEDYNSVDFNGIIDDMDAVYCVLGENPEIANAPHGVDAKSWFLDLAIGDIWFWNAVEAHAA